MKRRGTFRRFLAAIMVLAMSTGLFQMQAFAQKGDERFQETARQIAETAGVETVKTIWWKANTTAGVSTTSIETGETVKLAAGTAVTVIQRDYHAQNGVSQCRLSDGTECYIANQFLYFSEPLATGGDGDYKRATKEAYVNGQMITSSTNTLLWVSLDKQRVYVFKGSNRNWKLQKTFKASTGMAQYPTLDETFKFKYVVQWKKLAVNDLQFYTAFYGSGIHKWPGPGMSAGIGRTPLSHSCVRVKEKNAKWIFDDNNVPMGSRVWIW